MARATVELDFFGMEKETSSKSHLRRHVHRQRSFRDIQSAVSKINPVVLRSVIATGSAHKAADNGLPVAPIKLHSVPSSPKQEQNLASALPLHAMPAFMPSPENISEIAPMTIFYNGTVAVFGVPRDKAEGILRLAGEGNMKSKGEAMMANVAVPSSNQHQFLESLKGDLPLARGKSLQRFLEKRKERLTLTAPFPCSS